MHVASMLGSTHWAEVLASPTGVELDSQQGNKADGGYYKCTAIYYRPVRQLDVGCDKEEIA